MAAFGNTNGATPYCDLTADANGNLYGTNLIGNVFKIDTVSYALTTLANVNSIGAVLPYAGLISDAAGNLYGTTYGGGIYDGMYGRGVVFKVAVGTHEISTMASFNGDNGQNPYCKLIADSNGNLYGTTFAGGASNLGTVFKVSAGMHTIETLATFDGDNGAKPIAGLVADANGNLFGTTQQGGINNNGTVFKLTAGTHELMTLVKFNGFNGYEPNAGLLIDSTGNLFGTTTNGGPIGSNGTVFEFDASTNILTTLAAFAGANQGFALNPT